MRRAEFCPFPDLELLLPTLCSYKLEGETQMSFHMHKDRREFDCLIHLPSYQQASVKARSVGGSRGASFIFTFDTPGERTRVVADLDAVMSKGK